MTDKKLLKKQNLPITEIAFDEKYQRSFGLLAFVANRFILNYMRRITVDLDMDLETVLIWGTLAHMNRLPYLEMNANPMDALNELGMKVNDHVEPLRLSDLVQILGLPRETVRRKLENLQALGKVQRLEDGRWVHLSHMVGELERQFTRESVINLLQTAESLRNILSQVDLVQKNTK